MYSNQPPPVYSTQHYNYDSQSNSRNNSSLPFDQSYPSQSNRTTNNYVPPNSTGSLATNNHNRSRSSGAIEKTNKMSSENPFHDPARSYEQLNSARTITSITSPPKNSTGINKTLNLSDANPFSSTYERYHYPTQVDPSKRITNQSTAIRSVDKKSMNLSDENPFYSTYGRYQHPSPLDSQKRIIEQPKSSTPLIATKQLSNDNLFGNYRPSLIRQYSANENGNGLNSFSTSIADWTRNNPAPLSYRPIQVQRPPTDFYSQKEPSYVAPPSPPRQQRQLSPPPPPLPPPPPPPPPLVRSQSQKPTSSGPLEKTSLNMSPDNPFAQAYGRYHYPSSEEIKVQKRTNERSTRFVEQQPINDNRITQPKKQLTEYPETEKKDIVSGKGSTKFARFDVT